MEQDFLSAFLVDPAILAKVADRVVWGVQPFGSTQLPYINLHLVSAVPHYSLDGRATSKRYRVQVDLFAETYLGAVDLAGAVEALADGFPKQGVGGAFSGVFIQSERAISPERGDTGNVTFGTSFDVQFKFAANGL